MPQMAPCHGTAMCGAGTGPGPRRVAARLLRTTLLLLAVSAAPAHADFKAGAEAYARGDYKTAVDEWLPSAANGDPRALFNLGQMYRLGLGADKDLVKAEQYYRRAAELGHVGAQANLGSMLYDRTPRQGPRRSRSGVRRRAAETSSPSTCWACSFSTASSSRAITWRRMPG